MNKDEQNYLLENLAGIFIRCFFLIYALLLIWFVFYWAGGDWGYNLTSHWFKVSKHEYDLLCYCGIAFIKICALIFFLAPYIAIKLVLRKNKKDV
jgi:heme/copper-type cytochrome/quinol oxidase subunit 2